MEDTDSCLSDCNCCSCCGPTKSQRFHLVAPCHKRHQLNSESIQMKSFHLALHRNFHNRFLVPPLLFIWVPCFYWDLKIIQLHIESGNLVRRIKNCQDLSMIAINTTRPITFDTFIADLSCSHWWFNTLFLSNKQHYFIVDSHTTISMLLLSLAELRCTSYALEVSTTRSQMTVQMP